MAQFKRWDGAQWVAIGYRLESADHSHATTGLQGGTVAHSALASVTADQHHTEAHGITAAQHTGFPGGTSTFLRADATFATAGGGSPLDAWPIGSVFIAVVATSPATLLGGGTWVRIAEGKVLVGQDAADTDFDTAEETGGAKTHTHAGHSAHVVTQPAAHVVTQSDTHAADTTGAVTGSRKGGTSGAATLTDSHSHTTPALAHSGAAVDAHSGTAVDAHSAHDSPSHLPAYLVAYIWKRTA